MKNKTSELQIYRGIIHYLLGSTNYTLKNIADLSNCPITHIRLIYFDDCLPENFSSEIYLVKLFHMVLEMNINQEKYYKYCSLIKGYQQININ